MKIEFPYVKEKANVVPFILRPLARVVIRNKEREIIQDMYIDSGADITLLPFSVGTALGFEIKKGEDIKRVGGVGGSKISVAVRTARMRIGEKEFDCRIAWCLSEDVPLILGRLDVFREFEILFKEKEERIVFMAIPVNN